MFLERIDPNADESVARLCRLAHTKRYEKAASYAANTDHVLDAGCGLGYGTRILSEIAQRVVGLDISADAIDTATQRYQEENIEFVIGSLFDMDISELGIFNLITFFEVIEHLDEPAIAIEKFRNCIAQDGYLLLSTPNGNTPYINNPHHVREFTEREVKEFLVQGGFKLEQVLGQYPLLGSISAWANKIKENTKASPDSLHEYSGLVSAIPFVPEIFSKLYSGPIARATSRQLFYVARPA